MILGLTPCLWHLWLQRRLAHTLSRELEHAAPPLAEADEA
jgi:hypothetical protein